METNTTLLKTLTATFDLPLRNHEIPRWRGAFAELAGLEVDLFHNHKNGIVTEPLKGGAPSNGAVVTSPVLVDKSFHYRYPLIQYRSIKGKAAIFAINEGVTAIQQVLASTNWEIRWDNEPVLLQMQGLSMQDHYLQMTPGMKKYEVRNWLPLKEENHKKWEACDGLIPRVKLLEQMLANHLISFSSAMDYRLPERLEIRLEHIHRMTKVNLYDRHWLAFNLTFSTNYLLPLGIGLGKAVSQGFGRLFPISASE